ncbi:spondin domain-containing protein [Rubrivirga sp.]|uniref:spondin domain-containing protein n=1 Tax=Rubrivirga sp. TaxID=1885344 RepID=UPI003B529B3B
MSKIPLASRLLLLALVLAGCDAFSEIDPPVEPEPVRAPATYVVTFDATWSATTHPDDFPASAHFSPLVGATHGPDVSLWSVGETASDGVRSMAETGSTSTLRTEVEALGTSTATFVEGGIVGVSPGMATAELVVTSLRPLATVVTMLAPSPDWFVGVDGLDLREGDGWAERVTVDLVVYDAGTDDGTTYTAANAPRAERVPVAATGYGPLAGTVVGTLTFERQ